MMGGGGGGGGGEAMAMNQAFQSMSILVSIVFIISICYTFF